MTVSSPLRNSSSELVAAKLGDGSLKALTDVVREMDPAILARALKDESPKILANVVGDGYFNETREVDDCVPD